MHIIILKVAVRGRKSIFRILMRFFVTMLILQSYNKVIYIIISYVCVFVDAKNNSKPLFGASEEK